MTGHETGEVQKIMTSCDIMTVHETMKFWETTMSGGAKKLKNHDMRSSKTNKLRNRDDLWHQTVHQTMTNRETKIVCEAKGVR